MIRLHRNAAVIVAGDEEAMRELAAAAEACPALGPRLSPTVAWVDHHRVAALGDHLRRAGYSLRLVRDEDPRDETGEPGRNRTGQ